MTSEAGNTAPDPSTGTDEIITAALVQGLSYPEAGKLAGVSAKTVQRRMADPTFAAHVTEVTERLQYPERFADGGAVRSQFAPIAPMSWAI